MLKYIGNPTVTFTEFPDEIALCINITGCPCRCPKCSEPELQEDTGTILNERELATILSEHPGISLVGFMGGDCDHEAIAKLSDFIHLHNLKVGMYSGLDYLDPILLNSLDYYKIGRWITPKGDEADWWKTNCGPLNFTFSNQVMFKKESGVWLNITSKFREKAVKDLKRAIIE